MHVPMVLCRDLYECTLQRVYAAVSSKAHATVNREDTSRAYPYVLQKSAEAIETEEVNQTTKMEMLTETGHNTGL